MRGPNKTIANIESDGRFFKLTKNIIGRYQSDIILIIAIILISITAFNLGKISAINKMKAPITIIQPNETNNPMAQNYINLKKQNSSIPKHAALNAAPVVVSKNSAGKIYHFPWCSGASKITDKNKMTFATEAAAIAAGYTLAGNCQK